MLVQAAILLAFAAVSSSHLIMEFPAPFAWQDTSTKQAPLELGDFPCKQSAGAYKVTTMNTWNAGETQSVKIIGGATHGGGSCQFSITTDTKPTKDSQWKVIHSMIGGCPGGPSDNNLSNDAGDTRIPGIPVTMPENIPSGQYTFAWTWVNKLGNREFYMNCAPIQVGSGSGASTASADVASALGSLPDMFTINLGPTTGCNSTEGQDFAYPNPGKSTVNTPGAHPGSDMTGPSCPSVNKMGAGKGSLGTPSQGESPSAPSQPAGSNKPAPAQPTPSSGTGGIFAPGASSAPAPPQPTAQPPTQPPAAQPTSQPPTAQPPAAQPSTAPSNGTPAQGSGDCVPCSNDGAVVCIGTTQFGLCNRGCAVPQALAAGMACVNGAIGAAAKRHIHVPRAHLRSFVH